MRDVPTVIRALHESFPLAPYEGVLTHARRAENVEYLHSTFRNRIWPNVTLEMLLIEPDAILLLTPAAFVHYLPAFLSVLVRDCEHRADLLYDFVLEYLTPPRTEKSQWSWEVWAQVEHLTKEQQRAIALALEFIDSQFPEDSEMEEVVRRKEYWSSHLLDPSCGGSPDSL